MKKIYYLLSTLLLTCFCYSQSVIVTIDRENGPGPTATGNVGTISSMGLTRGSGIEQAGTPDFASRLWNANNRPQAQANNEYIQWSVTASANNSININQIEFKLRRTADGPANFRLYYSTNNFATNGIPVSSNTSLPAETDTTYSYSGLNIVSGTGQTITFRLYAWNASDTSGFLRFRSTIFWADYGIDFPGIRLFGNVIVTTPNSIESNIVTSAVFNPADNINYQLYNTTSGLTTSNSIKIGEFVIQDGGDDLNDPDTLPTILEDLEFNIGGYENLAALAVFDGLTNVGETTINSDTASFTGLNGGSGISTPDNSSKTFSVYATFNSTVTDNDQIQLAITAALADATNGSSFFQFDAGGAVTPIDGDDNRIEVTASEIIYVQQPSDVNQFEVMAPYPAINAIDSNGNLDVDFNDIISVTATGPLDPPLISYSIINGIGVFDTIAFSDQATGVTLLATPTVLPAIISDTFNILGPIVTIAIQDFDMSSPEWTYTSDVAFFDNGWGIDGYFGPIDIDSAAPLDYQLFSNNILGENDLDDEGDNGTVDFATITFDDIDISMFDNVQVRFDWQVIGYANSTDDAKYEIFYDDVGQGEVYLLDGFVDFENDSGSVLVNVPDSVDTVSLVLKIRDDGTNAYSGFDNFKVVSVFDGLIYANNSWTPYAPSDVTGLENAYVRDGNYIVGTDIELDNLFIEAGAIVNVSEGQSILVNNNIYNGGLLQLNSISTSFSSLIVDGESYGTVRYSRYTNQNAASGGNDLVSSPVTGQTFSDFAVENINLYENPTNPTEKLFGPFDKVTGLYLTYDTAIPAEAAVVLEPGIGYRAATSDGSNLDFTGTITTGSLDVPIVIAGPNNPEWNLIGNPYPSYLSLSDFLAINNSLFDTESSGIYGYDGNASDGWTIWNQAYSDANPGAVLTPGQGFFVASAVASGTVSFTPDMRLNGNSDDFIPGRLSNPEPIEHLKIQLSSNNQSYNTDFYFTDNATLGLDSGYDASIFGGVAPSFSIYSHLLEENVERDYAIQSLGYSDFSDVTIPLGINANQNQEITISIVESTLPESVDVYLDDTVANTATLLNNEDYTITPSVDLNGTGRFFLRFSDASLSTDEFIDSNNIQIFATINPKSLFVKGTLDSPTVIKIYDMQGRLVLNTNLNTSSNYNQIDLSNLLSGVYSVSLSNKTLSKTEKIIIK
ncbi:T9SS type A sorting domain-containing protein [Hanstruepera ponticola]|uniref:T9SS type A sorting domain-containing protein n=1 Tax=Hanstruepera ponticola TaxID=2042995 RepID=UPI0013C4FBAC|nr:T9SS type A sorting domain-containing protein [Hanstruepera ponticola]